MNCSVTGQQKEIETLKETIANLTKQLADKDKEQVRLNSSLSSLRDELEVGRFSLFFLLFVYVLFLTFSGGKGEELADQLAIPFSAVQTRSRKGDQDDQKHRRLDLLVDQIVLARPLHPQNRPGGSQRRLLAVCGAL